MFTTWDWLTLCGYLAVIVAIGFYVSRANKGYFEYMFGGGRMPWWAIGISLIATSVSATTFLGNPADTFAGDMTYLMCNVGVLIAIIIVAIVFIPRYQQLKVQSAYEILEARFSRPVRLLAATFYCGHLLLRTGILLYGPALVLAKILNTNLYVAITLTSVLAVVYTYYGGLRAVVWTDVLQFFVLLGSGLFVLWTISQSVGSWSEMTAAASAAGKTNWLDFGLDPANARTLLSAGLVYTVFEVAIRGCDQQFVQRYLACENVARANASSFLSAGLGLVVGLLFFWVGAGLFVYYRVSQLGSLPADIDLNQVFPHFIVHVLPAGMTGLLVAAIYAAAMSSLDSAITALANTTVTDFYPRRAGESPDLRQTKRWVLVWGVAGTLAAFLCVVGQRSLLTKALFFTSLFTGPLLGLFLVGFFRTKTNPKALWWGALAGMACLLPFSKIPIFPDFWWDPIYAFSWPWNPFISLTGTLLFTFVFDQFLRLKQPVPA